MHVIANTVFSVALHELAHLAAAFALGVRVHQVGINWKGPFIRRDPGTTCQNLTITLAGSGGNLLLGLLFRHINPALALNSLVLGLCNLLPFPSSDGSRAFSLLNTMRKRFTFRSFPEPERGEDVLREMATDEWREDEVA